MSQARSGFASARRCLPTWGGGSILAAGPERGVFEIDDPDFTANRIYTQVLGTMHLARVGVGVREAAPGVGGAFDLDPEAGARLLR